MQRKIIHTNVQACTIHVHVHVMHVELYSLQACISNKIGDATYKCSLSVLEEKEEKKIKENLVQLYTFVKLYK